MLDNIRLSFKEKNLVENWFYENSEKFRVFRKKYIVSEESEYATYPIVASIENLNLVINEKIAYLEGSLHKFHNHLLCNDLSCRNIEGEIITDDFDYLKDNNYNDFYYSDCVIAIESLIDYFDGLDLDNASISELEFGFNIITEKPPSYYKDFNFLLYEYKQPITSKSKTGEFFSRFGHCKFEYKVYSKKDQKKLPRNVLRIEIVLKSNHLDELGVNKLTDLLNVNNIESIFSYFMSRFEKFNIVDNRFEKENLPDKIRHQIGNFLEPSFWKAHKKKPNTNRIKKRFNNLLIDYEMLTTKEYITNLILNKFNQLCYGVVNDEVFELQNYYE